VWRKRRDRCRGCGRTFTETDQELLARQRVTRRFRRGPFERVRGGAAHAEVARCERTTRYQGARAFRAGADDELEARREARRARRLSLDEAHHRRGRELATVVSDLDRRCVVEVLDGRSRRRVERYLRSLPEQQSRAIDVVSIDPYDAYRQPIRAQLPGARIVADHFHLYAAPTPRSTPPGASASASTGGASRRALDAEDAAPPGAKISTAPATACSRPGSGLARPSAPGSACCSSASR
jgi:transposase